MSVTVIRRAQRIFVGKLGVQGPPGPPGPTGPPGSGSGAATVEVFDTFADVQAVATTASLIYVDQDFNRVPGWFRRDPSHTVIVEGADGVTDLNGVIFKRRSAE